MTIVEVTTFDVKELLRSDDNVPAKSADSQD